MVVVSAGYETEGMYPELIPMFEQMTPETFAGSPFEAEYQRLAPNPENFPVLVEKLLELDTTPQNWPADDIAGIEAPTLVISGKYDTMDPAYMAAMAKQLPHGELAATNGGHMAMYDDQPTYFAKLLAFLRKLKS